MILNILLQVYLNITKGLNNREVQKKLIEYKPDIIWAQQQLYQYDSQNERDEYVCIIWWQDYDQEYR